MTSEVWRPIPGFPDYEVSSLGQVASLRRGGRKVLAGGYTGRGYRKVVLTGEDGQRHGKKVHHLVAAAFLGLRPLGLDVLHDDDVKANNAASNLRYGTRSDNGHDAVRNGLHANARKTHCPSRHPYDEANTYVTPSGRRMCRTCPKTRSTEQAA